MENVLVVGFYFKKNVGDNLFIPAFKHLFPNLNFIFTDYIDDEDQLKDISAIFFGGGSFLHDHPPVSRWLLDKLENIFYIGIGVENKIDSIHLALMKDAKLIATRSLDQINRLKNINPNTIFIPDLVYSLKPFIGNNTKNKSVLVLPNISVVPTWQDAHWKHSSWNYFKTEFAQFLDGLIDNNYKLNFFSMCKNYKLHDDWATSEIISHMQHRNNNYFIDCQEDITSITELFSQYQAVITQRFHGIVLSEMTKTPYLSLHHHDKLRFSSTLNGESLSYYQADKNHLNEKFNSTLNMNFSNILPIESNTFDELKKLVMDLI